MLNRYSLFHLDPHYFPEDSRKAFSTSTILKHGALPLGFKIEKFLFFKRTVLNIGLLSPKKADLKTLKAEAEKSLGVGCFNKIRVFKIVPDGFLAILEKKYGVMSSSLGQMPSNLKHPLLTS